MRKMLRWIVGTLVLGLTMAGVHPLLTAQGQESTIVYGLSTTPTGVFHPLLSDSIYDSAVNSVVYDSLLKIDEDLAFQPSLAESYEVSEDNLTLSFILREGLTWSDGEPLTAEDVAFTFTAMADPDYQGAHYGFVEKIVGSGDYQAGEADTISGITVLDDRTLEVQFEAAYAPSLTNLGTVGIIPQHIWSEIPDSEWKNNTDLANFVGSGPFKLEAFEPGQFVRFAANDNHHQEVLTDQLVYRVVNEDTVIGDLQSGEVHIFDVSNFKQEEKDQLQDQGFTIYSHENPMLQVMGVNMTAEKLQDKTLRQALVHAINRQGMVDSLLEGNGRVVNTTVLTSSWAYPGDEALNAYEYDPEKAKAMLEEAGYEYVDGILHKEGEPFTLDLIAPTGNEMRELSAQIIQQNLKDIGIEVTIQSMEFPAMMDIIFAEDKTYELFLMGSNQPVDPDSSAYWHSEGAWNMTGFSHDRVDELLSQGTLLVDPEDRQAIYKEFAQIINEELPFIYLYSQNVDLAVSDTIEGFTPSVFRDFAGAASWKIK